MAYVRVETEQDKGFYEVGVPLMREVGGKLGGFLTSLKNASAAFRPVAGWRVEVEALAEAAAVFARTAYEVFAVRLSLEDEDPLHLDTFINLHLIPEAVRPLFDGGRIRDGLTDAEYEAFAEQLGAMQIPAEESLYYFLGAYWGEWLVRHRGAQWTLYAPLRPLQRFPDMLSSHGTAVLLPFSQAVKKLIDPATETLGYKAQIFAQEYLAPYPLAAALADATEARLSLLPPLCRVAEEKLASGDVQGAMTVLQAVAEQEPDAEQVLLQLSQVAWQAEEWEVAHGAMTALLRQRPHARTFYNLGVFYAQFDLLDESIESLRQAVLLDPHYDRAKVTMAALLAEMGETAAARMILGDVLEQGMTPELTAEAQALLAALGGAL